jgi:hypothetical protein
MSTGLRVFSPIDLEFLVLHRMPLIWSFYMNSVVGFGKHFPNLMVIHNINRSKWFELKYSATPRLISSKDKFQLEILLSKFRNYWRRKYRVLAIISVVRQLA